MAAWEFLAVWQVCNIKSLLPKNEQTLVPCPAAAARRAIGKSAQPGPARPSGRPASQAQYARSSIFSFFSALMAFCSGCRTERKQ